MKFIFFSDIHGNQYSFDVFSKILSDFHRGGNIVFLGDFVGYYYGVNEIIEYCRLNNFFCLMGNHDKYFLDIVDGVKSVDDYVFKYGNSYRIALNTITDDNLKFLRGLKKSAEFFTSSGRIYACHGSPFDNLNGRIYPDTPLDVFSEFSRDYSYIVTGHTHHKMMRRFGDCFFLNPGSLGQQRDGRGCSYLYMDVNANDFSFHSVDYDKKKLIEEIEFNDPDKSGFKSVLFRSCLK